MSRALSFLTVSALLLLLLGAYPAGDWEMEKHRQLAAGTKIALNVDQNKTYETIQDAVVSAEYGDTIRVFAGNYSESIFLWNGITLQGSGPGKTIITPRHYEWGIYIWGTGCGVEDLTVDISGGTRFGIYVLGDEAGISDCVIKGGKYGIYQEDFGRDCSYVRNTFTGNEYGLYLASADGVEVTNNSFQCSKEGVHMGYVIDAGFEQNGFTGCHLVLEILEECLDTLDIGRGNTVNGRPLANLIGVANQTVDDAYGQLILNGCHNVSVMNQTAQPALVLLMYYTTNSSVNGCSLRMTLTYSAGNSFTGNEFTPFDETHLIGSDDNVFEDNVFSGGVFGLSQYDCVENIFRRNTFSGNVYGASASYSSDCVFEDNVFTDNSAVHLSLYSGFSHIVRNCTFYTGSIGLQLQDDPYGSTHMRSHVVEGNEFGDLDLAIVLNYTRGVKLSDNEMNGCGVSLFGREEEEWSTHDIDATNTVDGKPLVYLVGLDSPKIPNDAGQVILASCTDVTVSNRTFSGGGDGLEIGFCTNVRLNGLIFKDSHIGFVVHGCEGASISDVQCSGVFAGGYLTYCTDTDVEGSYFQDCSYAGLVLAASNDCRVRDNMLEDSGILIYVSLRCDLTGNRLWGPRSGILAYSCSPLRVHDNSLEGSETAILVYDSGSGSVISNNGLSFCGRGIYAERTGTSRFENNTILGCELGIHLSQCDDDLLENNTLMDNTLGIWLNSTMSCRLWNNTVSGCLGVGMAVNQSQSTIIYLNTFIGNGGYGIVLDIEGPFHQGAVARYYNTTYAMVYYNIFKDNNGGGVQALDNGYNNRWNKDYGGNRWSDHTGPDKDGNGFVDNSYGIDGSAGSADKLPLVDEPLWDSDGDGYNDHVEDRAGTDPLDPDDVPDDADGDLIPDRMDPDMDGDGLLNAQDPDIDGDGHVNEDDFYPEDPDRWEEDTTPRTVLVIVLMAAGILITITLAAVLLFLLRRRNRDSTAPEAGLGDEPEEKEAKVSKD